MRKELFCLIVASMGLMLFPNVAAAQGSRASVSATEVTATFRQNIKVKFKHFPNDLKILPLGPRKIPVAMDLVYPYSLKNGEPMVNLGTLDGEAAISADTAIYTSEDSKCKITIKFVRAGTITVTEDDSASDCGFGHNVFAHGTYLKVSSKKPTFEVR